MPTSVKIEGGVVRAAAWAAAIVLRQHRIAVRREHLALEAERMLILPVRSAVDAQEQRNLCSFHITNRISQQAMNVGSVFALKSNFFALRNLKFGHQRIVLMGKRLELHFAADDTGGINLVVMVIVARDHHRARSPAM